MYKIESNKQFNIIKVKTKEIEVEFLDYGARIYSLKTKDYQGTFGDIVLQYSDIEDYINDNISLNATIGPIAGRVKNAKIEAGGRVYHLDKNSDNKHTLHGGSLALSSKFFDYEITEYDNCTEVMFLYEEESTVKYLARVFYQIYDNKININYEVESDQDFVFSLTNHAYFNLSGDLKRNVKNHIVYLKSNKRHEVDNDLIFTGNIIKEEGMYDFTKEKPVNDTINSLESTTKGGIDDTYYFPANDKRFTMAFVYEPISKRMMKIKSSYDHLVFYSHNNINHLPLKHIEEHKKHYALCFECEKGPYGFYDSQVKNNLLKKGKLYQESILFEFLIRD